MTGLVGCARSQRFFPQEEAALEELVKELSKLYDSSRDQSGRVRLNYRTCLYLAIPSDKHI